MPRLFQKLPIEDLLELMAFLGKTEIVVARGNPFGLRGKAMSLDARVLDAGAATILGWPAAFDDLARLVRLSCEGESGLDRFGYLHRYIARSRDRSFSPILHHAYRQFLLIEAGYTAATLPEFLSPQQRLGKYITAGEARRMLGLRPAMFAKLKATSLWDAFDSKAVRRGRTQLLPRGEVVAFSARVAGLISFSEAGRLWGLRTGYLPGRVPALIEGGLLQAFPFNKSRESHQLSVERTSVEDLLARSLGNASDNQPCDPMTFGDIFTLATRHTAIGAPLVALFKSMIDGRLRGFVADPGAQGVEQLIFERKDAELLIQGVVDTSRSAVVPMDEAARLLGLRTPVIHALLRAGLLPPPARRGTTYLLDRAAVDGFWAKFDTPRRIAARSGKTPSEVEETLKRQGEKPAGEAVMPGRRTVVFYWR